jgi:hypothetical protein
MKSVPNVLPDGAKSPLKNEPITFKAVEVDLRGHLLRSNKLAVAKVVPPVPQVRIRDRVLEGVLEMPTMAPTPTHL